MYAHGVALRILDERLSQETRTAASFMARAGTSFRVATIVLEAVGLGKFLSCWIGLRGANDLYICGHLLAPPTEADHRDFDGAGLAYLAISTSAGFDLDLGRLRIPSRLITPLDGSLCPPKGSREH